MAEFVLHARDHAKRRVSASPIVEDLQVLEDRIRDFNTGLPSRSIEEFDLHGAPGRFDHRVAVAVAHGAHRWHQPEVEGAPGGHPERELRALVAVDDGRAAVGSTLFDRRAKSIFHECGGSDDNRSTTPRHVG